MPTPSGATQPFALPSDLVIVRDWAQICDWCLDATASRGANTITNIINDDIIGGQTGIVTFHLGFGAGLVESATLKGEFYLITDLQALTGNSLTSLKMLNCWLAIMSMSRRKTRTKGDLDMIQWAIGMLDSLEKGERIFSLAEVADAELAVVQQTAPYGSREYFERPSIQAMPMFGQRGRGYYGY